jgi:hypothetical protein
MQPFHAADPASPELHAPSTENGCPESGPCAHQRTQAGIGEIEPVDSAIEVEMVEAAAVAMLHARESGGEEFTLHLLGAEEEAEGFAGGGDAGGEQVEYLAAPAS